MFAFRDRIGPVDLAFTDRFGGISAAPYDELDLALPGPGDTQRSAEYDANWRRVLAEFAPGEQQRFDMRQVHGSAVHVLDEAALSSTVVDGAPECDAVVTTVPGPVLTVRVADCVPVLMVDPVRPVTAAVHVGRRGLVAGVLQRTVEQMRDVGAEMITAWVGPHVCGSCYEVPDELRDEVAQAVPGTEATTSWGTPSLDLGAGVASQLHGLGVREVRSLGVCTLESPAHHSYRRDGARSGRQVGLVRITGAR